MATRATLALLGAEVRTLDPRRPRATAVAVGGDRILAVGDDAEIRALCGARTEVLDLAGAAVVPGLVDAHMHPLWAADLTEGADCTRVTSLPELAAALRAERTGSEAVVRGWGVDYAVFAGAALDGRALEELAGGPAVIAFFDLHTHLATPAVLARAGVDGPVTLPDNGEVVCDGGVPTGELREFSAYERVAQALPAATRAERIDRMASILRTLNAAGLTGAHVMDGTPATFDALRELEETDRLTLRLVVPLVVTAGMDAGEQDALVALRGERGRLWRGGAAKFFLDGVIETGTAWLEEPDTRGGGTRPVWPDPEDYARPSRASPAPASRSRRMPLATGPCARCSMPTGQRPRVAACGTGSSTSRRSATRRSPDSRARTSSPRCSRSTCAGPARTRPTSGACGSARSAPRAGGGSATSTQAVRAWRWGRTGRWRRTTRASGWRGRAAGSAPSRRWRAIRPGPPGPCRRRTSRAGSRRGCAPI